MRERAGLHVESLPVVGRNHDGLPLLQWTPEIQATVIEVTFGRGRLIVAHHPDVYQHPDGRGGTYTDGWCYESLVSALVALAQWNPCEQAEPDGWVKHIRSGRRRLHGEARFEYSNYKEEVAVHWRWEQQAEPAAQLSAKAVVDGTGTQPR